MIGRRDLIFATLLSLLAIAEVGLAGAWLMSRDCYDISETHAMNAHGTYDRKPWFRILAQPLGLRTCTRITPVEVEGEEPRETLEI